MSLKCLLNCAPDPEELEHLDDERPLPLEEVGVGVVRPHQDEGTDLQPLPTRNHVHDARQLQSEWGYCTFCC